MNTLQQIVDEMKADFLNANKLIDLSSMAHIEPTAEIRGISKALEKYIPKLESLLNEQNK